MMRWSSWIDPRRASIPRALIEAGGGCTLFMLLGEAADGFQHPAETVPSLVLFLLGWTWLAVWPAWRLRPVLGHSLWIRLLLSVGRGIVIAVALSLAGHLLAAYLWPQLDIGQPGAPSALVLIAFGFLAARLCVTVGAMAVRRVRSRLRWQLMASHVGVIVLTLGVLTSIGSVVGISIVLWGTQPDPRQMARSAADQLRVSGSVAPLNRGRANLVLREIQNGTLVIQGEPPLTSLIRRPLVPAEILLLDRHGTVVLGQTAQRRRVTVRHWANLTGTTLPSWSTVQRQTRSGHGVQVSVRNKDGQLSLATTPIRVHGRTAAFVALLVSDRELSQAQLFEGIIAVFGAATLVLVLVASLPLLGLSFLFAYLSARGLTRRLESVSQVATSIAAGDLAGRAPVSTSDEVGRLARNINQMAGHLEATMSELREARGQAVEALRTRQELVANISHELRTPLAILRAHLENLTARAPVGAGSAAPEAEIAVPAATVAALQHETERLGLLVDDLFALSRAQAGGLEIRREPVDVAALIDEIAAIMRPLALQDGTIAISVEAPPGLPRAMADAERLRQIISNLVRNAVRHTPDGGIIVLSVSLIEPWIVVSVADTGEGIPAHELRHVFERFYRVDQARSRESGGAGLGLAIVQELVELMGGRVEAESVPGEGSQFRVFLPLEESKPAGQPEPR